MPLRRFRFWPFGGLERQRGIQRVGPARYSVQSAASVDVETALQVSAFWACARLIAETVAGLPLQFYRVDGEQHELENDYRLAQFFDGRVNAYQNRQEFIETMVLNLAISGNAYARIRREGSRIVTLMPMMSSQVETELLEDGAVVHKYTSDQGVAVYAQQNVWHLKLFGNGITGLSPLAFARNAVGIALASENRVSNVFRNGGKPTGVLMIDRALKPEQREQVRESLRDLQEGQGDSLFVLEAGMQYQQVSMSPQDIQLLESRKYQVEDICRFMGVPSVLVNDTSSTTAWGSGVREIIDGWYKLGLKPYLSRIEESIRCCLLPEIDMRRMQPRFNFDDLLRGDKPSRMEANQKAINSGQMTPNEARVNEGRPRLPGGDTLLINGALIPIDMAGATRSRPEDRQNDETQAAAG